MARCKITCIEFSPLLIHNVRLANPLDPLVREIKTISGKRKKTDEDHETMARLEHAGSMYYDHTAGPYILAENIRKTLIEGARKTKEGKLVEQAVFDTMINPLVYDGPRDLDGLWTDKWFVHIAAVTVLQTRVMRTRPIVPDWAVDAHLTYDPTIIDFTTLRHIAQTAGTYLGLGDYRPLFGRYRTEVEELTHAAYQLSLAVAVADLASRHAPGPHHVG